MSYSYPLMTYERGLSCTIEVKNGMVLAKLIETTYTLISAVIQR